MNDFKMLVGDGRITFERIVCRSPEPDAVFPDTGNQRVLDEPTETLDKANRSATAKRDDRAITILESQGRLCSAIFDSPAMLIGACDSGDRQPSMSQMTRSYFPVVRNSTFVTF